MKKEKSNLSFCFKQSKGLRLINPNENLGGGRPILVVVDTTDVQKFPFKECLAVSFNDSIIGREIEDFGSAFARLKFNLINNKFLN